MTAALAELAEDPGAIVSAAGRVLAGSRILRRFLLAAVAGPLALILSIVFLLVFRRKALHYRRRR